MFLEELQLKNFRNYNSLKIKLNPHINIIYGNNAQGKTNLLESIYVLGLTKSHLYNLDNNLIKKEEEVCKIKGKYKNNKMHTSLEIEFTSNSKKMKIDKEEIKRINNYIHSSLNLIVFYPEDLEIIKGSPTARRNFMNLELSQLSDNYLKLLTEYNKLLKIRNEYLKKISKNIKIDETYFEIITNYLVDKAFLLYKMRNKFIDQLNNNCGKIFYELTQIEGFHIKYVPNYIFSTEIENIKEKILEKFKSNHLKEIRFGTTLYGPHRDEIEFYIHEQNLKDYGSQGQKRIAILSVKLAEIEIFKKFKDTNPILLLDDVFSELDDIKKNKIIKYISNDIQVIITTTELKKINQKKFDSVSVFKIKNGEIIKSKEVERNGK